MNFKNHLFKSFPLFITVLLLGSACGLKRAPRPPKDAVLPSIPGQYMYKRPEKANSAKESEEESGKADLKQKKK